MPFYGGAKGQVLQINRRADGTVTSEVIKQTPTESAAAIKQMEMLSFQQNLVNIQRAASQLVNLQQTIKNSGRLSDTDRTVYADNLAKLGVSAQNLAHIQQAGGHDDFRLLFDGGAFGMLADDDDDQQEQQDDLSGEKIDAIQDDDDDSVVAVTEEEENVGEEESSSSSTNGTTTTTKPESNDSVQVNIPDKDASVAEAKPVGKLHNLCLMFKSI